jgi:hypothetical protein
MTCLPVQDEVEEVILTFADPNMGGPEEIEDYPPSLMIWSLLEVVGRRLRLQQQMRLKEQKEQWLQGYQEPGAKEDKAWCNGMVSGQGPVVWEGPCMNPAE